MGVVHTKQDFGSLSQLDAEEREGQIEGEKVPLKKRKKQIRSSSRFCIFQEVLLSL